MSSECPCYYGRLFFTLENRNVEAALGGKVSRNDNEPPSVLRALTDGLGQSDPYVRVQINNVTQGRTEVVNNSKFFLGVCVFNCWNVGQTSTPSGTRSFIYLVSDQRLSCQSFVSCSFTSSFTQGGQFRFDIFHKVPA